MKYDTFTFTTFVVPRQLPSFEETHMVMGGCIVVERDDMPQFTKPAPPGMFDERFGVETKLASPDIRHEV